jgi:hypothetical protein
MVIQDPDRLLRGKFRLGPERPELAVKRPIVNGDCRPRLCEKSRTYLGGGTKQPATSLEASSSGIRTSSTSREPRSRGKNLRLSLAVLRFHTASPQTSHSIFVEPDVQQDANGATCKRRAKRRYAGPRRIVRWAATLVDDLICPLQQWPWNFEAERAGSSLVDDKVDLGGLLDRQISRLRAP